MKKILFFILLYSTTVKAQDETIKNIQTEAAKTITKDPADTIPQIWKIGGLFSFTLAQGSLSNWAAGGEKFSLSLNTFINAHAFYQKDKNSWDNNFDYYAGYVRTTSLGSRKNDDRFEVYSKYGYALTPKLDIAGLFDLRSQFFKGYIYPEDTTKIYSSNFFAPAYLLLSPGLDYHPVENFSIFVSPATARWVIVDDIILSTRYGLDSGKKTRFEFGAYATMTYAAKLGKAVTYNGKLDLFSNYSNMPQNIDLYMTNLFTVSLSKILSATWNVSFIYDHDVKLFGPQRNASRLQVQSLVGLALLLKF